MIIYYDSYCKLCSHSSVIWKKMDRRQRLHFSSFRNLDHYPKEMEQKLHVYNRGKWFKGYDAIIAISKKLPLLWLSVPILTVLKWIGLGDFVYNTIAKHRQMVPVNQCDADGCQIKS
ncbi:thiol-disulfide oxidoreductase DCC family protein [Lentibacillus kimchii]|uniref:Thiol-disulfide oxidoreductase DCC family protein n=1 Tax=Lentibacillus kimchii TaxID=1542911 RepID=A0ABW2UPE7_9BACI